MPERLRGQAPPGSSGTWEEWRNLVLYELERLATCYEGMEGRLRVLELKAAGWGAGAAVVVYIATQLPKWLG